MEFTYILEQCHVHSSERLLHTTPFTCTPSTFIHVTMSCFYPCLFPVSPLSLPSLPLLSPLSPSHSLSLSSFPFSLSPPPFHPPQVPCAFQYPTTELPVAKSRSRALSNTWPLCKVASVIPPILLCGICPLSAHTAVETTQHDQHDHLILFYLYKVSP